ncbi:unnamed protein product [Parnassius apollo]|uniref:(apollo) hypothetical protein n=1 Tax=Parnassius apollo TaxID=110799 RepID=A0A8S3WCR3_PARAO|nr:unnamed protein product [Parnassius apollo]
MVFEFNRVCFGLKSSPFHALRTVKQLAHDEGPSYPKAKRAIESGLYMDDFVYSVDSVEEATLTTAEVIKLMKSGQFDLVKWTSNSRPVLDTIPLSHRLSAIKEFDDSDTHKVLGLCWSPESDVFSLKTPARRLTGALYISTFRIMVEIRLASLVLSRESHPRKVVSLARLELCAILVLNKLITAVISACRDRVHIERIFAFSDSTVALCWVHSSPHRWDTFVANRVAKIQDELETRNFYHVSGTENPADCLSRGLTPMQIMDHPLWFHGPSWVHLDPSQWPITDFEPSSVSQPPEEKRHALVANVSSEVSPIIALANRLSSWSKLLRSVIYVCRFAKLLPRRSYVLASDYNYAESLVLRELQRAHFSEEITRLQSNRACSRAFQRLKPFLQDGIVRVGGRLSNSQLSFDQRHPIVLPRKDHILNLLVDYHHKLNSHAGPDLLMSILRQNYWILSARSLIRNRVHRFIACFRARPKSSFPEMAELRSCRVIQSVKPFTHTGSDFAGPFKVTLTRGRGIRSTKAYVCIFVCLTTRAVHIELVGDQSTAGFMGAFKRFLSRRGPVSKLYSDNGTNYVGAKLILSELHELLASKYYNSEFAHILAENRIEWSLNVPTASHFGGNWETNIKSLKSHLYRVIGDQILSFEELSMVLAQIECVMNSRPLCRTLSSDPSEPLALTPAHFLNLTPLRYLPAADMDENRLSISARYKLLDRLVQSFWKRWRMEYLHTLQSRQKWNAATEPLAVGTVVVLTKENTPPLHWPLGIVEEVFPGSDGVIRIARVKTTVGSYLRPVVRGVLHIFPNKFPKKFPEQFKAWAQIVSGKDECDFDYKKMKICDQHFTERDRNRNNRLNALAVPSLLLHGSHADVPIQNEQSASTNIMSEKSLGQPEVSDDNQSMSDNVADVQTQIKAGFPITTMCEQSAGQTDNYQCTLDLSPEVSSPGGA